MKTFLVSMNLLGLSTFVTPIANLLSNSSVIDNNNLQVTDEYEVKSNYSYHSGWVEVDFDDTVLITTIYKEVNKLLLEQQGLSAESCVNLFLQSNISHIK